MTSITNDQFRKYFEHHLAVRGIQYRAQANVRCLFHDDKNASLSINMEKGAWKCHAGCGEGGIIDFEMKMSGCDRDQAKTNITNIVGADLFRTGNKPEAVYQYRDANGALVFEKVRYPGKKMWNRRKIATGWVNDLEGIERKPLYNLPELVTANVAIICEGEKDCDNTARALATVRKNPIERKDETAIDERIATTTNFDGAGKWSDEYNPYFAGKRVIIFPDNDAIGMKHAESVARSVYPYAVGVKIVSLPGLAENGDVSDYLQTHSAKDLIAEVQKAKQWLPPKVEQKLFVPAPQFVATIPDEIDWLIEGVIQRGSNGMITAVPKGGKSWVAIDMAIALALGEPWLGFRVPRPVRIALISREDNPTLTSWRMKQLYRGRSASNPSRIQHLQVNTPQQSPQLLLDDNAQLTELMDAMQVFKPEFAIFDVFNVLHTLDENDNSEMRRVLRQLSRIQSEIKCGIGVVHHYNKAQDGSITQRLRGASAIAGWCEWVIGIEGADEETQTRRMKFELKAAQSPEPVLYRMIESHGTITLQVEKPTDTYVPITRKPVQPIPAEAASFPAQLPLATS